MGGVGKTVATRILLSLYNESCVVSSSSGVPRAALVPCLCGSRYIPNHCSGKTADLDFFRRVRASYYVVSGNDPANGAAEQGCADALLEGKAQWGRIFR